MSLRIEPCLRQITKVIIYKGHEKNPLFGPYPDNIIKRIEMFEHLNRYREKTLQIPWKITSVAGEQLVETLKKENPENTLLVIPAGQSTRLDKVFSLEQTSFIKEDFLMKGGRGYFNCGSAYWVSSKRIYNDLCEEQPENRKPIVKTTNLSLFDGLSEGPLCPYPGQKYKVGFFSDAVRTSDGHNECTIYLSGGGCFVPDKKSNQKILTLARYLPSELLKHGKTESELSKWEKAAILISVGKGAALLSMFHPYYGSNDMNVSLYEQAFPDSGTNWSEIKRKLSPLDVRMRFAFNMISKLETMEFQ